MRSITLATTAMLVLIFSLSSSAQPFRLVKDINKAVKIVSGETADSNPSYLTSLGNTLFFRANDSTHGVELWRSDGTEEGTILLSDINAGTANSDPAGLIESFGYIYFSASHPLYGFELWKTQSSPGSTILVSDLYPGTNASFPGGFANMGARLYFSAYYPPYGNEVYFLDHSTGGINLVYDIYYGFSSSYPGRLTPSGASLFFTAYSYWDGGELWKYTPGPSPSAIVISDFNPYDAFYNPIGSLTDVAGVLFFTAQDGNFGNELWKVNSSGYGVVRIKDIAPGTMGSYPSYLTNVNGILYFTASNSTHGYELWRSDGSEAGTWMVADINPGVTSAYPADLTNVNGVLYFTAIHPVYGKELWKSDGTEAGTVLVKDIWPGDQGSSAINLKKIRDQLLFSANNGTNGEEVWRSDGTTTGTVMVQDIVPGSGGSAPRDFTECGVNVFFVATTPDYGSELWVSIISAALPLSRVELKGNLVSDDINLQWISFNEQQVKSFEVQRSTDGAVFTSIGKVAAKGAPHLQTAYEYTDFKVEQYRSNELYYRLKIIDEDGSFEYSNVIRIAVQLVQSTVTIWPNPVHDQLQLQFNLREDENIKVSLYDQQGRLIQHQQLQVNKGVQKQTLSLAMISNGVYFLKIYGREINQQFKVEKQ